MKQKYTGSEQKLKSNDDRVLVLAVARSMCCRIFFWMHVADADCFDMLVQDSGSYCKVNMKGNEEDVKGQ